MTFEEAYSTIKEEIKKRRGRWTLSSIGWMDFDDVSQIVLVHIHKKWDMYNQSKPLLPWVNRVISSQIRNLVRNNYTNYARPCLRCAAAQGEDLCSIYGQQCEKCPLYKIWVQRRKQAYEVKLPVSLENHNHEVNEKWESGIDIELSTGNIHNYMHEHLKPNEWIVYKHLYIDHFSEDSLGNKLGYKPTKNNKVAGYKQIQVLKRQIINKVKKALFNGEIEMI